MSEKTGQVAALRANNKILHNKIVSLRNRLKGTSPKRGKIKEWEERKPAESRREYFYARYAEIDRQIAEAAAAEAEAEAAEAEAKAAEAEAAAKVAAEEGAEEGAEGAEAEMDYEVSLLDREPGEDAQQKIDYYRGCMKFVFRRKKVILKQLFYESHPDTNRVNVSESIIFWMKAIDKWLMYFLSNLNGRINNMDVKYDFNSFRKDIEGDLEAFFNREELYRLELGKIETNDWVGISFVTEVTSARAQASDLATDTDTTSENEDT